ncbi:MAG: CBS domain-containing protein, partial [Candidatus Margulisiibacteriota bacterium]
IEQFRALAKDKDVIMYLYITDENNHLLGVLDIKELLTAEQNEQLADIMTGTIIKLTPENTIIDAAKMFSRYNFRALPIVAKDKTILGVIPYRDIMNLTHHFID